MPDQLFDSLTEEVAVRPLPAAEVRRRGDRRRRKQQLAAGVACVAAIVAVVLPISLARGGTDRSAPPIATSPETSAAAPRAVTMVPADFPLAAGMPHERSLETLPLATEEEKACGTVVWGATRPIPTVDGASVGYESASQEGGLTRSIALYASTDAATSAVRAIESTLASCGSVDDGAGKITLLRPATATAPTDVWVVKWTDASGLTGEGMLSSVTHVGNALLLDSATFMSAGDDTVVQREAAHLAERSATVIAAMCVFSDGPCPVAHPTAPAAPASQVLGPTGYDRLTIGMSYTDALATGDVGDRSDGAMNAALVGHPDAGLCLSKKGGLMAVFLGKGMRTAEGVRLGSSVADLEAAYPALKAYGPDSVLGGPGVFRAPASNGLWYEIDVANDRTVSTVILRQDHQTCFE